MTSWLSALGIGALVVAIVGAFAAYIFEIRKQRWLAASRARNRASALHGEIGAIVETTLDRYLPMMRLGRDRIRRRQPFALGAYASENEMFGVYRSNVAQIGALPHPLPDLVSDLYTRFLTIQEDLRTVVGPAWQLEVRAAQQLLFLTALVDRLESTTDRAATVRSALSNYVLTGQAGAPLPRPAVTV